MFHKHLSRQQWCHCHINGRNCRPPKRHVTGNVSGELYSSLIKLPFSMPWILCHGAARASGPPTPKPHADHREVWAADQHEVYKHIMACLNNMSLYPPSNAGPSRLLLRPINLLAVREESFSLLPSITHDTCFKQYGSEQVAQVLGLIPRTLH